MGIISWIIFGALAGWIASLISGNNEGQGWIANIALGVVGALVGGFIWHKIKGGDDPMKFNIGSLVVAIAGALLVSFVVGLLF